MNPFDVFANVQDDYLTYVRTFQRFQNLCIRDWVTERIEHGTLLWKPPFVQLSRPFAPGDTLQTLVEEGLLHLKTPPIFRYDPDDPASSPVHLYRHQSDAIRAVLGFDSPSPTSGRGGQGVRAGANVVVATASVSRWGQKTGGIEGKAFVTGAKTGLVRGYNQTLCCR